MKNEILRKGTDLMRKNIIQATLDSREVAGMMGVRHTELLRKIDRINSDFTKSKIAFSKYWIESDYKDSSGKTNRSFEISKRGCEFLAHKTIGTKGNLFTDKYMDKFEVMENYISNEKISTDIEERLVSTIDEIVSQKVEEIENKCSEYYRPSSFEKYNISNYIKKRLGIRKANKEYDLVKQRVLIKLGATKWEDIDVETLKNSLNIIDESIRIIKAERPYEQRSFFS